MSYPLPQLVIFTFLTASLQSLGASPGANVPWITYEAENMANNGGTLIGPPAQVADISSSVANSIEMEASGGKAIKLTTTGQYVELTAQAAANSIVGTLLRAGLGQRDRNRLDYQSLPERDLCRKTSGDIKIFVAIRQLSVLQQSWRRSAKELLDEVRLNGLTINAGDTVRIEKDADDTASYDVIDLVDLENVAAPLDPPANILSITSYGAVGNGTTDCTTALQNCINDAKNQGKTVWMPTGTYIISGSIYLPSGTVIQGAGMWHTTLLGNASVYNSNSGSRITLNGGGSNIHLSDFAITGFLNYRNDSEPNDGLGGSYGTGSTVSHIWVEHTKTGAWLVNSSGLVVDGCRFRNTIADGINLCVGMRSCTVTNCTARGTGDDCFAIWPATYTGQSYTPGLNVITHCTGQAPNLANGGAIYGGVSNRIEDCAFMDVPYGCGILIAGTFPVGANVFSGTTVAQRCDLTRCGGYDPGWQWRAALTLCPQYINITNVNLNHLNITNSLSYALQIVSPNNNAPLSNATMNIVNISNYGVQVRPYQPVPYVNGVYGVWARSDAVGSLNIEGLSINGAPITSMPPSGSDMRNQSSGSPQNFVFNFMPAPVITQMVSGNILQLSWSQNYLGWTLQAQTNEPSTGIGTNWEIVSGSANTNQFSTTMDDTTGSVFFRLIDL